MGGIVRPTEDSKLGLQRLPGKFSERMDACTLNEDEGHKRPEVTVIKIDILAGV